MTRLTSSFLPSASLPSSDDGLATVAEANIRTMMEMIGRRELPIRAGRKIVEAARTVHAFADEVGSIVRDTVAIARAGATCERDIAALRTEIDGFKTQQAVNAAARAEADARGETVGAAVREEMETRKLTSELRNTQLRQQIDALKAASRATPTPAATAAQRPTPRGLHVPDVDDATLGRLSGEAHEIVRQVQAGNVPKGLRYPHHAFAACLYLRARLDGLDTRAAALYAHDELVAHFLNGADLSAAQIRAFAQEYLDLKKRLDQAAASKQGTDALQSLQRFGVVPSAAAPKGVA